MSNNQNHVNEYSISLRLRPLFLNLFKVYFSLELRRYPGPSGRYHLTRVFFLLELIVDLLNSTSSPSSTRCILSVFDSKRFRLQAFPTPSVFSWALMNGILTSKVEHGNRRSLSSVEWKALHLHGRSQTCRFFCWQSTRSSKCFIFRSFRECALTSQRRKTCILTRKTPPVLIFVKIILIKIVFLELITTKMQVSLESVQWPFHPFGLGSIHVMSQLPQHPNQPFMQQTHHKMLWIQNSTSAVLELSGRCGLNTWLFMMPTRVTRRPWHLPTAEALSRRAEFHSEENKQMESITLEASYSSVEIQLLNRAATSGSNKLYKHELT